MKTRKFIVYAYAFMFLLVLSLSTLFNNRESLVFATSINDIDVENYTDFDNLLKADGSLSNKNIIDFSNEVKAAEANTSFPELAQVVPKQYLESTTANATYQFNGKEYGFYMVKEGDYFDLLLIDFVYEFDSGEHLNDYVIKVKPILQQSFLRTADSGNYTWLKYGGNRYKYYVANPRFLTVLQNENALNYGDIGYAKSADDGLIISQSRFNFGKVCYKTEADLENYTVNFWAEKALGYSLDLMGDLGSVISIISDCTEYTLGLYNEGKETTVYADNENNIFTHQSKSEQINNSYLPGFSRAVGLAPTEEIILSSADDSYAEFIVLLSETNYKSRLTQICEFDIARRQDNFSSMEYIAGNYENENEPSLIFGKERVLFSNTSQQIELEESNFNGSNIPLYLLYDGEQTYEFTPQYSGIYNFTSPTDTLITIIGNDNVVEYSNNCSVYLKKNSLYKITVKNISANKINQFLNCNIQTYTGQPINVERNDNFIVQYDSTESGYKKLMLSNSNCGIKILDANFNVVMNEDASLCYFNFENISKYYFLITNNSGVDVTTTISILEPSAIEVGEENIILNEKVQSFTNPYNATVQFNLIISWEENSRSASIYDIDNNAIATVVTGNNQKTLSFTLEAKEKCYIVYSHADGSISSELTLYQQQYRWLINDTLYSIGRVELPRGETYEIEFGLYFNGSIIQQFPTYISTSRDEYFTYSDGLLHITYNAVLNYDIFIIPDIAPESLLTICVIAGREDINHEIILDMQGGTGGDESVTGFHNKALPVASSPQKIGYSFAGYYTLANGQGLQYYDANMNSIRVWNDENNTILYAKWVPKVYTITYNLNGGINSNLNPNTYTIETANIIIRPATKTGYTCTWSITSIVKGSYGNKIITATWTPIEYRVLVHHAIFETWMPVDDGSSSYIFNLKYDESKEITAKSFNGFIFKCWIYYDTDLSSGTVDPGTLPVLSTESTVTIKNLTALNGNSMDVVACYEENSSCIALGSLITLADGTQKAVEALTGNEMLLVWNLQTGTFDTAPILFIDSDSANIYEVVNLYFSDGTCVKVISEHGFWDFNLNKYVYMRNDAAQYIGHWFNKQTVDEYGNLGWMGVQLINVIVQHEYTTAYSPVTYGHLCYYVNGMLSMPGGIDGLFNIFEVDEQTMKYDIEAMQSDINTYGLFTYEEFNALYNVPEVVFEACDGQYLKVAIGKGLITHDEIVELIEKYAGYIAV